MAMLFDTFRWIHIFCGFLALCIFWIPIVTKKGGRTHSRVGWVYVTAMAAVSVSALFMGIYRLTWDAGPDVDAIPFSWFLINIAILSAATAWYGIRVLRFKRRKETHRGPAELLFALLLLGSSIAVSVYGWTIGFALLQYFPIVGMFLGGSQLVYWLTVPKNKAHWAVEHIVGMLSCCIATVTAFTVFGAPRLLHIESVSLFVWLLPTIVMVPLIIGFTRKYQRT
ncbi:DUF2306 domain-containing protein [Paenibacillus chartarius]|uniref:DUF2306 domain-containing protein n=1 Tax=Paenibacillus chartarius TaxID=747481 RepID=A0ABV6DU66_9BACL